MIPKNPPVNVEGVLQYPRLSVRWMTVLRFFCQSSRTKRKSNNLLNKSLLSSLQEYILIIFLNLICRLHGEIPAHLASLCLDSY